MMSSRSKFKEAPISLSAVQYERPVGKRIEKSPDDSGGIAKKLLLKERAMPGKALNLEFSTARELFDYRMKVDARTMFFAGTFSPNAGAEFILPKKTVENLIAEDPTMDGVLCAATKDSLAFREGASCLLIDIDHPKHKDVFPKVPPLLTSADDVRAAVLRLLPEAKGAPMLIYPSSSSLIVDAQGGGVTGPGGWRVVLVVSDGRGIPKILETVHLRAWAQKFWAYAFAAKGTGAVLIRSLADQALGRPAQPDYPMADLGPGLERKDDASKRYNEDGQFLDPESVLLTDQHHADAMRFIENAKSELRGVSERTAEAAKTVHSKRQQDWGVPKEDADRSAAALVGKAVLLGSSQMEIEDGTWVRIADLMGPLGAEYDGRLCADPLEPDYDGGRTVGKFYWNNGKRPGVNSFARGGRFVAFRHDTTSLMDFLSGKPKKKGAIIRAIALSVLSGVEEDQALKHAARALGLGNSRKNLREEISSERRELGINVGQDGRRKDFLGMVPLAENERIPLESFPFKKTSNTGKTSPVDHKDNLAHLLECYDLLPRYNEITKQIEFPKEEVKVAGDNTENAMFSKILSLMNLNDLPNKNLATHLTGLAETRPINPVTDFLKTLVWDDVFRISPLADQLGSAVPEIRRIVLRIFFCQACAAADHAQEASRNDASIRAHFENILVFVGPQGAGKTKGLRGLLPAKLRRYFKEGVALDPRNKDSIKQAISAWITELGELDATFRKADIAQLKAFVSSDTDEIRMPYAPTSSKFKRRTAFVGTVNDVAFLADNTGNRRFIPLEITSLKGVLSTLNVDQLWAEAWHCYVGGQKWWPTDEEAALLAAHAEQFRAKTWIEEKMFSMFDATVEITAKPERLNATEIFGLLQSAGDGSRRPTQLELKDVAQVLRRFWQSHPQVRLENGIYVLTVLGEVLPVQQRGGKNNGWLKPPETTKLTSRAEAALANLR